MVGSSRATLLANLAQTAAMAGIAVLLSRSLGPRGFGTFTVLVLLMLLSTLSLGFGIGFAAAHHVARGTYPLATAAGTVLGSSLATGGLALLLAAAAFMLFRHSFFHEVTGGQIALSLAAIPLMQLATSMGSVLLGLNNPARYAWVSSLQFVVALAGQLGLAAGGQLTPTTAIAAWTAGSLISALVAITSVGRLTTLRPRLDRGVLRTLLGFGLQGYLANGIGFLNYRLDSLLLNALAGAASVGYYTVAVGVAESVWYVANAASLVMFPRISGMARGEADRLAPRVCRTVMALSLLVALGLALGGRQAIAILFGPALLPAAVPMLLLLPGTVALSGDKVISSYLSGIGKPIYSALIAGGIVVLTVGLDLTLIPRYGIAGAAVASSVVYLSLTAVALAVFRRLTGTRLRDSLLVRGSDFKGLLRRRR